MNEINQLLAPPQGAEIWVFFAVVAYIMVCVIRSYWET
jgi:hypothetical protein